MNAMLKAEGIKLVFSLLFMLLFLTVLWFALPKITDRAGAAQAKAFWRNEVFQNRKRLFGEGDDE